MAFKVEKSDEQWRRQLTEEQYLVCRKKGTERPFSGAYCDVKEAGLYRCVCCGAPVFGSSAKFDSGSGWPSYFEPVSPGAVITQEDRSHGMRRTEALCATCGAHLGHVFEDGPPPTGLRYCINSVCLDLEPAQGAD